MVAIAILSITLTVTLFAGRDSCNAKNNMAVFGLEGNVTFPDFIVSPGSNMTTTGSREKSFFALALGNSPYLCGISVGNIVTMNCDDAAFEAFSDTTTTPSVLGQPV